MQVLCIMHDKMDHSKTASPCFALKKKSIDGYLKLLVGLGMDQGATTDVTTPYFETFLHICNEKRPISCGGRTGYILIL
jgi:hypothetical protein